MLPEHYCLEADEVAQVVADLRARSERSINARLNLIIFRLSCCEGLRASEIAQLKIADVVCEGSHPTLTVRAAIAKGGKRTRYIPLTWSPEALADLAAWHEYRRSVSVIHSPFVCSVAKHTCGKPLTRFQVLKKWRNAIRVLGPARVRQLSVHKGRHSFISHAGAYGGLTFPEVAALAGHASPNTTAKVYSHVIRRLSGQDTPTIFRS